VLATGAVGGVGGAVRQINKWKGAVDGYAGALKPVPIAKRFAIDDALDAYASVDRGRLTGNAVFVLPASRARRSIRLVMNEFSRDRGGRRARATR